MRRRRFFKTLAAAPAVPALLAQQVPEQTNAPKPTSPVAPPPNPAEPPAPLNRTPPASAEYPKLETAVADDVAEAQPRFFSAAQMSALQKLSDLLMPRMGEAPGALDAGAPQFLDFLIGRSPRERQDLYRSGLDALNSHSKKRFSRPFSDLDAAHAPVLLASLKEPWTYEQPSDPLARFLRAAKQDVRAATTNSLEYAAAATSGGGRRGAGLGLYWYPLD